MITPTAVHLINVATHFPAIVYIVLYAQWDNWPLLVLLCSVASSCLMHVSETKHHLPGLFGLATYSNHLLNMDRFFAVVLALLLASYAETWRTPFYFVVFMIATVASLLGELTQDHLWYVACHTIWHLSVFYMAGYIVTSYSASNPVVWVWSETQAYKTLLLLVGSTLAVAATLVLLLFFHPPQATNLLEVVAPNVVWRMKDDGKRVLHLTVDDGPTTSTRKIVDLIQSHKVGASYFTPGENLVALASLEETRYMTRNGSTIENHMYLQEAPASKMTREQFADSVNRTQFIINAATQFLPTKPKEQKSWLRPASGISTPEQIQWATRNNYRIVVGSVHPFEAKPSFFWSWCWRLAVLQLKTWFVLVDWASDYGHPIVILHDRPWTVNVLSEMIPWWKARGWSIRALPTL